MNPKVHPSAIVAPGARLAEDVLVGAYAIVEEGAVVGPGCTIDAHAVLRGRVHLGAKNHVHPFAVLGGTPQDRTYRGEETEVRIGDENVFREHVTVHSGTEGGGGVTRIGHGGLFMAGTHIAHDVRIGDGVTLANATLLAGHVHVDDGVVTGGQVAIAPFVKIGRRSFIAGGAMVERDVPPFVIAAGDRARVRALNRVGLLRAAVPEASRRALARAFRLIFSGAVPRAEGAARLLDNPDPFVRELASFVAKAGVR